MRPNTKTLVTAVLLGAALAVIGAIPAAAQNTHSYNFDNGDPQGWTPVDLTATPLRPFTLQTYEGRSVVWCGKDFGTASNPNPGYGNKWDQFLVKEFTIAAAFPPPTLEYDIQYDTEPGFDEIYVEWSLDGGASFTVLAWHSGWGDEFMTYSIPLSISNETTVLFRFRFSSDGAYSDEDGYYNSNGAFRLDEVRVAGHPADTFDTDFSGWTQGTPPGMGGEFRLVEHPECSLGVPCDPGTWPYVWSWVAYDPATGRYPRLPDSRYPTYNLAIDSPFIPITPGEGVVYTIEFDVHDNLPVLAGVFYQYQVACPPPEDGGTWKSNGFMYYGPLEGGTYYHYVDQIPQRLIDPTATSMRIRLAALDRNYFFTQYDWTPTAAPFFDNITLKEEGLVADPGRVAGTVTGDDPAPGTAMFGVRVNAYDTGGDLVATTFTDESGAYEILELEPANYTVSVVAPLGYSGETEAAATVLSGQTTTVDFAFSNEVMVYCPRTIGYWKHQVKVATPGDVLSKSVSEKQAKSGVLPEAASPVCDYLDLIATHFNGNLVNEVVIYEPPASGECSDKVAVAGELLNLHGAQEMMARARQQLMAVLLNTASGCLPLNGVISDDGAVVSQAITFCDNQIDAGTNLELAKDIADYINNGWSVPAGWIPLETPIIFYEHDDPIRPAGPFLAQNHPNPFRSSTAISFRLAEPGDYTLAVFDVAGRLVRRYEGYGSAGETIVSWDGRDAAGQTVAPGIYYYRVTSAGFEETRKALVMR